MIGYFIDSFHLYEIVYLAFISLSVFSLNIEFFFFFSFQYLIHRVWGKVNYHHFTRTEDAKTINRSQKLWFQASCSLLIYSVVIFPSPPITLLLQWNELAWKSLSWVTYTGLGGPPPRTPDLLLNKDILLWNFFLSFIYIWRATTFPLPKRFGLSLAMFFKLYLHLGWRSWRWQGVRAGVVDSSSLYTSGSSWHLLHSDFPPPVPSIPTF